MPGFVQDSDLQQFLADALKKANQDVTTLANGNPSYWPRLVTQANATAYNIVFSRMVARGYTPTQIASWDRGYEFQKNIGLYQALLFGACLNAFDKNWVDGLKRYFEGQPNELDTVLLTIGGQWQAPADTPGTVGTGALDFSQDNFVPPIPSVTEPWSGDDCTTHW